MIAVDRSRFQRLIKHCPRARYLAFDFKGIGLRPKAEALPLATGTSIHAPFAEALLWMKNHETLPTREQFRAWISQESADYKKRIKARGFDEVAQEDVAFIAGEQAFLIEGMLWAAFRCLLPWLHSEFKVLDVEKEETYVLACSCGLGDGVGEVSVLERMDPEGHSYRDYYHEGRTCDGVVMMSRPDCILERRSDGMVGNGDLKSNAYAPDFKGEDHVLQIAFGTLGAERRLGRTISHYYIFSLLKGKRDWATRGGDHTGDVKRQQSILCYAYYKGGDPPFDKEEFRFEYTREKGFAKLPLWLHEFEGKPPEMSSAEWWVMEKLPLTQVEELVHASPAFQRPDRVIEAIKKQVVAVEREWAYKVSQVQGLDDPAIDDFIPQSWDCHQFYGRSCEFLGICRREGDWTRPEKEVRFLGRRANHLLEGEVIGEDEVKAKGFQVAGDEDEDWGGE